MASTAFKGRKGIFLSRVELSNKNPVIHPQKQNAIVNSVKYKVKEKNPECKRESLGIQEYNPF
jgi:hypothetical protein